MPHVHIVIGSLDIPWLSNQDVANTLFLIVVTLLGRFLFIGMIRGKGLLLSDTRRRWISVIQNASILFLILGLVFIWSPQLSAFALSLTAFAVALVLATKEYILCIVGAVYRTTTNPFVVGDWIEIQNLRGEVLTVGMLTIKLQELGHGNSRYEFTGRTLTIPNSLLLNNTIANESTRKSHLYHTFRVTVDSAIDPTQIINSTHVLLSKYKDEFDKKPDVNLAKIRAKVEVELPSKNPTISIETTDTGKIIFNLAVFCEPKEANIIETQVTQHILAEIVKHKMAKTVHD